MVGWILVGVDFTQQHVLFLLIQGSVIYVIIIGLRSGLSHHLFGDLKLVWLNGKMFNKFVIKIQAKDNASWVYSLPQISMFVLVALCLTFLMLNITMTS